LDQNIHGKSVRTILSPGIRRETPCARTDLDHRIGFRILCQCPRIEDLTFLLAPIEALTQ